jgi:DNA-binding NtrC family response regulator
MAEGNLLIVDDEELLVKLIKKDLEKHAAQIFTAFNGLEALELLRNNTIHCILCDINMPKMNGVELLKHIRTSQNDVPFIFFTGHGSQALMMEAVKYGAFDFLDKPDFEGLEDVVRRGLDRGTHTNLIPEKSEDDQLSEYRMLLKSLES